ncbi:MAG: histidine--tRNA ligase, partial [Desulfovibrionaceae bacterium]
MSNIRKIKGFNDLFGPDSAAYTRMENTARRIFARYGFQELRTPVLEKTELFSRSIGEETDVVSKEMYTFDDRKGRSLTLRPEATAGVCRAFIEAKAEHSKGVARYFTTGPMFRYERPQKGRQRQFHQINAEILGACEPEADAELMLMLHRFLDELGLKNLRFEVNSLGCADCRPAYHQALGGFLAALDAEALCPDCRRRRETNPLRVLDCKIPACKELVKNAPAVSDHLDQACREHFQAVLAVLDAAGLEYELNPRLVRGLDYYQRTTFEVLSGEIGAQSAVAGGGRYDGLIKDLGGPAVPGTGFACGMERLVMLLPETEPQSLDFYVAALAPEAVGPGLLLAEDLRGRGLAGECGYASGSLKSRLRQANRLGARFCIMLGPDELAAGTATAKDLAQGGQTTLPQGELAEYIGRLFKQKQDHLDPSL